MDVPLPGHDCLGNQPGVVDVGGGRCVPEGASGRQGRHEVVRQADARPD